MEAAVRDRRFHGAAPPVLFVSLFLVVTALQFTAWPAAHLPHRPVLAILFLCTARQFGMDRYTVFLNKDMLRNMRTDPAEATELLTVQLIPHLLLYAALPIALLAATRVVVRRSPFDAGPAGTVSGTFDAVLPCWCSSGRSSLIAVIVMPDSW